MSDVIEIEVALARPSRQQVVRLAVPAGCTARRAVALACAAGLDTGVVPDDIARHTGVPRATSSGDTVAIDPEHVPIGVHGERVADDHALEPGDRVELYRPLPEDPRARRRRRAAAAAQSSGRSSGSSSGNRSR